MICSRLLCAFSTTDRTACPTSKLSPRSTTLPVFVADPDPESRVRPPRSAFLRGPGVRSSATRSGALLTSSDRGADTRKDGKGGAHANQVRVSAIGVRRRHGLDGRSGRKRVECRADGRNGGSWDMPEVRHSPCVRIGDGLCPSSRRSRRGRHSLQRRASPIPLRALRSASSDCANGRRIVQRPQTRTA